MAQAAAKLVRFTPLMESGRGASQSVPTKNGRRVYKDVTIIKTGLGNHRDKNFYPLATLERAVKAGSFEGLRAYADHPDSLSEEVQPERTIRDMVGIYQRPRIVRESADKGRIVADLHLFRSSKWLSDTVDDLIDLNAADRIGLSINGRGRTVEKQMQIEEAADPVNVNWVEDFLTLRSADVVTEAGAGGGFQQLLESARGSLRKETDMKRLTEQQQKAIKAATDANDVEKLTALMQECGLAEAAPVKKKADKKAASGDDAVADDAADDADAAEDVDPDVALDEAADAIKDGVDGDNGDGDATDVDEADGDVDDAEDLDGDADEDPEAEADETREADPLGKRGAGKLISGKAGGKHGSFIKGAAAKNRGAGSMVKTGGQNAAQKGRRFGEADPPLSVQDRLRRAERQNEKLREDNARLSSQLRVRTTTDRARNLLRESSIPGKLQPEILRLMVAKSEDEMRGIIRYHERMVETAVEEATGGYAEVEGAGGSRIRESYHGSGDRANLAGVLDGLPLK